MHQYAEVDCIEAEDTKKLKRREKSEINKIELIKRAQTSFYAISECSMLHACMKWHLVCRVSVFVCVCCVRDGFAHVSNRTKQT